MRRRTLVSAAVVTAALAVSIPAPAQAYDVDAYVHAAGHMLRTSDVPKGLGDFGSNMGFYANSGPVAFGVCSTDTAQNVIRGGTMQAGALFSNNTDEGNSLSETVLVFSSNSAAIKAFNRAKAGVKPCLGTQSGSWSDDSGTTYTYSSTTTTGSVPKVTVTGVPSFFLNTDHIDGSSDSSSTSKRDSYTVYTLVGDTIIATSYNRADDSNVSTALRQKVNQAAFTAVTRWVS